MSWKTRLLVVVALAAMAWALLSTDDAVEIEC